MGTITINLNDNVEERFRKTVKEELGVGKGKLGKAVTEALQRWTEEKKQKNIADEMIELMTKGFNMGKRKYKKRDELHAR